MLKNNEFNKIIIQKIYKTQYIKIAHEVVLKISRSKKMCCFSVNLSKKIKYF